MTRRDAVGRACLLGAGTLAWVLLAVLPGGDATVAHGGAYVAALLLAGTVNGVLGGGRPGVTSALLAAPALLTLWSLALRGGADRMWAVWNPVVLVGGSLAAIAHAATRALADRRRAARGAS